MDRVYDDRNTGHARGQSTKKAGFAAVRVNDIVIATTKQRGQRPAGAQVKQRVRRPAQGIDCDQRDAGCFSALVQGTFRTGLRTENQVNLVTASKQTNASRERVFLCAADNQAGDNMTNAHACLASPAP